VERDVFPRDRPGESLHPGVEALLGMLGVADAVAAAGFLRYRGHWVEWAGPRHFEPFGADAAGPWRGWQVWRADFDAILLERARALGVAVLQPRRALRPLFAAGRIAGLLTPAGSLQARWLVDAAGSRHWLARSLGLERQAASRRLLARYGYTMCAARHGTREPLLVGDSGGWTWTARVRSDMVAWTRLQLIARGTGRDAWPHSVRGCVQARADRGADVTWRQVSEPAGPGYFMVGDAASVLDPTASHGVLKALVSGISAGQHIVNVHTGVADESTALPRYAVFMREWFKRDVARMRALYDELGVSTGGTSWH
jgi:flavin-dependent dehydrogenase